MTRWMDDRTDGQMDDETDGWNDASGRPLLYVMIGKHLMSKGALSSFLALVDKLLNVEQFFHWKFI